MHKRNYHNAIQPYRSPIHHVPPPTPTPRTRSSILKNIPHLPIYLNHPLLLFPSPPLPLPSSKEVRSAFVKWSLYNVFRRYWILELDLTISILAEFLLENRRI